MKKQEHITTYRYLCEDFCGFFEQHVLKTNEAKIFTILGTVLIDLGEIPHFKDMYHIYKCIVWYIQYIYSVQLCVRGMNHLIVNQASSLQGSR